jgi:WD40 repeat protein
MRRSSATPTLVTRWQVDMDGHHIVALDWSPDGRQLAAAGGDGPLALYGADGTRRHTLPGHGFGTLAIAWHPDSALLVSSGQDGRLRWWNTADGSMRATLDGGAAWVERVAWSPPVSAGVAGVARGRHAEVRPAVVARPSVLASSAGRVLRLWDDAGQLLQEVRDHASTIADLAWLPTGAQPLPGADAGDPRVLAVATYGGLTVRHVGAAEPITRYQWRGSTLVIAWSPDGRSIATGDQDATVHFWLTRTGEDLQMYGYPAKVRELSWDSTSRYLATGGGNIVTVWDCSGRGPEGTRPIELRAHEGQIAALAFRRRDGMLASACTDGLVALWQVGRSTRPIATLRGDAAITRLAWSPDDQLLALAGELGTIAVVAAPR